MITFVLCFLGALLGSTIGICAAAVWALKQNNDWKKNH